MLTFSHNPLVAHFYFKYVWIFTKIEKRQKQKILNNEKL